ncbi:hydroxylamine reductase [Eggerthellaceae bacterium zg-887]|nr:hydroxylamine reductase [Xiamenia xianingshaonis]
MFCFQCEQTAGCTACTGLTGVCGKTAGVAKMQDQLTGALVALARAAEGDTLPDSTTEHLMLEGMFACVTNVSFDEAALESLTARVRAEIVRLVAQCSSCEDSCGRNDEYDMGELRGAQEDIRSLKSLLLFGMRGVAAYAYHADSLGERDPRVIGFLYEGMRSIGRDLGADELLPLVLKCGEINLHAMAVLERANLKAFGIPAPATLELKVEKGPFIVVTGHDLEDLEQLLQQTKGMGVNVYTHGEMLPAHAYPELRKYPHLKGNYGTAWQNQRKEFEGLPAPILWTTNCLMAPDPSYADRVFTTGPVSYPGAKSIACGSDGSKDFSEIIGKAIELGGWSEDMQFSGMNGGASVTTGFGYDTVMSIAPAVVDAVKGGKIRHFVLLAGCDGARKERGYYTEFAKQAPADTVILTLACGKYRFNDLDLGDICGIPRLLDVGQCNDAYGAIKIALALAESFECGVNELPLSMVLSWYEQKAVSILLTLLHLGIKGIYLGPTLPAFVSPAVLDILVENFGIRPISTPEQDLSDILF